MAKNVGDPVLEGQTAILLGETTTPSAQTNFAQIYTKSDNKVYFQDGAGVEHTVMVGATGIKHLFVQALDAPNVTVGNWELSSLNASGEVHFIFHVPDDFESLESANIIVIPDATETIQWDANVSVSAIGQNHDVDDRAITDATKSVTVDDLTELDVSAALASLVAGEFVAFQFLSDTANIRVVGLEFDYN